MAGGGRRDEGWLTVTRLSSPSDAPTTITTNRHPTSPHVRTHTDTHTHPYALFTTHHHYPPHLTPPFAPSPRPTPPRPAHLAHPPTRSPSLHLHHSTTSPSTTSSPPRKDTGTNAPSNM